jgi:hypothetical protein
MIYYPHPSWGTWRINLQIPGVAVSVGYEDIKEQDAGADPRMFAKDYGRNRVIGECFSDLTVSQRREISPTLGPCSGKRKWWAREAKEPGYFGTDPFVGNQIGRNIRVPLGD